MAGACLLAVSALGCGTQASQDAPKEAATRKRLTVFAASSLTEAFTELAGDFERSHPNVHVVLTFAGSQALRLQLEHGAQADVFASANELHMRAMVNAGLISAHRVFAHNEPMVIVPHANPARIEEFSDLTAAGRLVLGTRSVPIGRYARQILTRARRQLGERFANDVRRNVVSEEGNARLVRAKVELGEADAAIVYRSDAIGATSLRAIPIPPELNVQASYPIGLLANVEHPAIAHEFVTYLCAPAGQRVLERHGLTGATP